MNRSPVTSSGGTASTAPVAVMDVSVAKPIYDRVCGLCHPDGNEDVGPNLHALGWDEARVRHQIREGGIGMNAIRVTRLSDPDLEQLMPYLRVLGTTR